MFWRGILLFWLLLDRPTKIFCGNMSGSLLWWGVWEFWGTTVFTTYLSSLIYMGDLGSYWNTQAVGLPKTKQKNLGASSSTAQYKGILISWAYCQNHCQYPAKKLVKVSCLLRSAEGFVLSLKCGVAQQNSRMLSMNELSHSCHKEGVLY